MYVYDCQNWKVFEKSAYTCQDFEKFTLKGFKIPKDCIFFFSNSTLKTLKVFFLKSRNEDFGIFCFLNIHGTILVLFYF